VTSKGYYNRQYHKHDEDNIQLNISPKVFNEVYLPYLQDYSKRYEVYFGGRGSGKSIFILQKLLIKALSSSELDKSVILILRKYGTTLKDSVWQATIDILSEWKLLNYCHVNNSSYRIVLPNSSLLLFKGLDSSEKLKSISNITDCFIEEASEFNIEEIEQIDLSIRGGKHQQIFYSFNPTSKANWTYKKWFSNVPVSPETLIVHSTYKDNRFLPKAYVDTLEAMINSNPFAYKVFVLGEWATLDRLVYQNWTVQDFDKNELIKQRHLETLVGLDFGFTNDATCILQSLVDEQEKTIYICSEYYAKGMTNKDIADALKYMGLSKSVLIADCAEPKSIQELKNEGISRIKPASKGKDSINAGIDKINQYRLIVHPDCVNTIIELQNYSYQKDKQTGEYTNKPIDTFNHCLDALRYSLQCLTNKVKMKSLPKSLFGF